MRMATNVCEAVFALTDLQVQLMDMLNRKFYALRRLAQLLEQAGDLTGFIPDITRLIPLSQIDLLLYEQLRNDCPFLNLPPSDSTTVNESLGKLQGMIAQAYGQILAQLNNHPWQKWDQLTRVLDEYQTKLNVAALAGQDFLTCLSTACATIQAGVADFNNLSKYSTADATSIAQAFSRNYTEEGGRILTDSMTAKQNDLRATAQGVRDLFDVPGYVATSSP